MNEYIAALTQKSELRVMMVCLGNICRSPMAAAVLENRTRKSSNPKFVVTSSGTGAWHVGEGPNPKSKLTWEKAGYDYEHTAQQFKKNMFIDQDLLLVMDKSNFDNVSRLSVDKSDMQKVFYLRQFDPSLRQLNPATDYSKLEVPDPYYEPISAYQEVLVMVENAVTGLIELLSQRK